MLPNKDTTSTRTPFFVISNQSGEVTFHFIHFSTVNKTALDRGVTKRKEKNKTKQNKRSTYGKLFSCKSCKENLPYSVSIFFPLNNNKCEQIGRFLRKKKIVMVYIDSVVLDQCCCEKNIVKCLCIIFLLLA